MENEQYRLHHFRNGELPSGLHSALGFFCENADECICRIVTVMELITENARGCWQEDDYWSAQLPDWLLKTFTTYTREDLSAILADRSSWDNLSWTFGSWLDRMRDRDWEWWSLEKVEQRVTVFVVVDGYPCSTKALEHLITAAGGHLL